MSMVLYRTLCSQSESYFHRQDQGDRAHKTFLLCFGASSICACHGHTVGIGSRSSIACHAPTYANDFVSSFDHAQQGHEKA